MMLWEGQPFSFEKTFSNVFVTSHRSCVFLYLFSSANISLVRFVVHLQDWWCVGKRETSFPVNKMWLINLPPSLWPLTMIKREMSNFKIQGGLGPQPPFSTPMVSLHFQNIPPVFCEHLSIWFQVSSKKWRLEIKSFVHIVASILGLRFVFLFQ